MLTVVDGCITRRMKNAHSQVDFCVDIIINVHGMECVSIMSIRIPYSGVDQVGSGLGESTFFSLGFIAT